MARSRPMSLKNCWLSAVAPDTAKFAPCRKSAAVFPARNGVRNGSSNASAARSRHEHRRSRSVEPTNETNFLESYL